jgi:O-phosphoseryl-tRNA(Cys) synthetase
MELSNMPIEIFNLIAQHADAPTYVAMKSTCKEANEKVIAYEVMRKENARKVCAAYMQVVVREACMLEYPPAVFFRDEKKDNLEIYKFVQHIEDICDLDYNDMRKNGFLKQSYFDAYKYTFSLFFIHMPYVWNE